MVYLATKDGAVIHHTSLDAMLEMDGIAKPEMEISDEEFEAAGGVFRIVDGRIVLGKTEAEIVAEKGLVRLGEIDAELDDIDRKSGRPARAVASAIAKGGTASKQDLARLDEFEKQAGDLRKERSAILAAGAAG